MAYNIKIDQRIQQCVSRWDNVDAKKMFGGVCHLLNGNMFCGVHKNFLILRLGPTAADEALAKPFTKPFDITGKPMKGWVMVSPEGFQTDAILKDWLLLAKGFVLTLPAK